MSLLAQIGGQGAVEVVAHDLYTRILADAKLAQFFVGMSIERQEQKMVGFLTAALGGHRYVGRGLHDAHKALAITSEDFLSVALHLHAALTQVGVAEPLIDQIMALAASIESQVVTMSAPSRTAWLLSEVADARGAVVEHPVYAKVATRRALATFMEHHVFAVWDFMSLLKALQRHTTCVTVPWIPNGDAQARRLVNSIVLDEESDKFGNIGPLSHFEMYLGAMREVGADTTAIQKFIDLLRQGHLLAYSLMESGAPAPSCEFVLTTMDIVHQDKAHELASAFTIGREDAIPDMFQRLLDVVPEAPQFHAYLERHIEVDGGEHQHHGFALIDRLCGVHMQRWQDAAAVGRRALQARAKLWAAIQGAL